MLIMGFDLRQPKGPSEDEKVWQEVLPWLWLIIPIAAGVCIGLLMIAAQIAKLFNYKQ